MGKIDCNLYSNQGVKARIQEFVRELNDIEIENTSGKNNLLVGINGKGKNIRINDDVGYYCCSYCTDVNINIYGNVGWYTADTFSGNELNIFGYASTGLGINLQKGTIRVNGNAGERIGCLMKNGNIIVNGNSGKYSGLFMMGGNIIIDGDCGDNVGESMFGGNIFISGDVGKLGSNCKIESINDEDYKLLNSLLLNRNSLESNWRKVSSI